jgi:sulfite exporter TauE/SafE/copper chaperone CopZ
MTQTYTFHVNGMHCHSCVLLTESELKGVKGIVQAKTSLQEKQVEVTGEFENKTREQIMNELNEVLKPHGYSLSLEKAGASMNWSEFFYALPLSVLFMAVFILLQKIGIVNLIQTGDVTYGTAFIVGLVASVSTCMAVVGGIVLSLSANYAKEGDTVRPQTMFHVSRLVSFFFLGGLIGILGSIFQLGATGALILGLIVALVLLILGINLLDMFPWMKKLQLTVPTSLGSRVHELKKTRHLLTPIVVGAATFFLPCGFTQSMQIYTLTTSNFLKGGLTMLAFALGTLPVLALLSFSSLGVQKRAQSGIFFKTAGLIVIFFAIFNLINTLVGAGIIDPVFNF